VSNINSVLLSTAYLAPIQYYTKLLSYQNIYVEAFENYTKQTYRNRCNILSANGQLSLSIPVKKTEAIKIHTKDIQIDYSSRWQLIHERAIESAYRSSPFYIYYADDIKPLYEKQFDTLLEFNLAFQKVICELIGIKHNPILQPIIKK
jgi:aspartyl/asparaginyl-tRNA synthetase